MSRLPGPVLLPRSASAVLVNTESMTAGTQEREPGSLAAAGLDRLRAAVSAALTEFLDRQRTTLAGMDPSLVPVADEVSALAEGGKRLRPAFAYWGWRGASNGTGEDDDAVLRAH